MCGKSFNHYLTHKKTHQYRCSDISEIKLHNAIKPIIRQMFTNAEKFIEEYRWKN
jgi:hypothetical protein